MLRRNCLLLFLCFLFEQSSCAPFQSRPGQEWPHSQTGPLAAGRNGGSRGFQRVKRGWVWNQFFVLEEYMGSDPQYVGKLHTDLDNGESAVKYTLSGDGAGTIFTIDQITGDIHALRSLDREEKPYYTLRAQAVDIETNRPLEPESEFVIKVQDINDNEPKFLEGPYMASVPEMSPVGTYVMKVTAADADDPTYGNSARVVYSILHGQPYFSVDAKTGVIRTALPNMDREVKELYQVLIQAKDMGGQLGGLAGTTTINITLSDVNDNPPRFSKSEPLYNSVGSAVGRIKAHDLDIGKNAEVEYNIVPGDGGAMFDITTNEHNQEGIIMLKKPLDYETKKAYTFKVEASNAHLDPRFHNFGPFKDTATVKINILDVDEPPVFSKPSYAMDVYEDTPQGTIIGAVTAQDLDAGNSPVRYSIDWKSDLDSFFDIDPVRGTISTNELLDRESIAQHNISVVATKNKSKLVHCNVCVLLVIICGVCVVCVDNPVLTSRVAVTVHVLDINEFPPELAMPYERLVRYAGAKPLVTYSLFFFLYSDNTAGVVTLRGGFKRRSQEIYHLPVVIEDGGLQILSSTGTLTIRVCGCDTDGSLLTCSAEGNPNSIWSENAFCNSKATGILFLIVVLYVGVRRQKKKETLMTSKEDVRDNVIHYDDEGGGEEDTHAFDMGTLRNPKVIKENMFRRDVKPELGLCPRRPVASQNSTDISNFISLRLQEHDGDTSAPPYDSLATYAYEGEGSVAESLSSIESVKGETEEDYNYLNEWGPRFKTLAGIFGERSESQSDVTLSTTTENKH
uniref:Cadherin-12 n=1 Tax=Sinocyclocheilus anshuiensis TaxID=1608454 RepID=A0A671P4P7_9TELE